MRNDGKTDIASKPEDGTAEMPTAELDHTDPAPDRPPNGIFVEVTDQEDGSKRLNASVVGETRLTEAPVLLRLAAQEVERRFGL